MMGLGTFPTLVLADARRLRVDYLFLVANGIASQTQVKKVTEQQNIVLDSIFSIVAANWFSVKQARVTPDYDKDIWWFLGKDRFPVIGEIPAQEIKAHKLVEALGPIKARGAPERVLCMVHVLTKL